MPVIEGGAVHNPVREVADVCVVGTGAGGAVVAAVLAEAGARVVVLEKGGFYTAEDFTQREDDMLAKIEGGGGFTTSTDGVTTFTYGECVGGSTVHYWADTYPIPGDRLALWNDRFGIGRSEDSLAPSFARVAETMHVVRAPEHLMNENNRLVRAGMEALGWADRGEVVTQARRGCVGCGYCQQGCAYNAKMSTLTTYVPIASRAGARLYADCAAEEVVVSGGRVRGVRGRIRDRGTGRRGPEVEVRAGRVVVAAGGLGSPLLLLRSQVAGGSGQLGKNLVVNPGYTIFGLFDRELDNHRKPPCTYAIKGFRQVTSDRGRYLEGGWIALSSHQFPAVQAALLGGFGREHRQLMEQYRRLGSLYSVIDDEEAGEVALGPGGHPRITYRTRGRDVPKVRDFFATCARVLLAAGAREVWVPGPRTTVVRGEREAAALREMPLPAGSLLCAAPHLLGTCRMGADPHSAVVAPSGECHEVRGLFVADGSIMPGSISVDPSLTIMAFADAIARGIAARG